MGLQDLSTTWNACALFEAFARKRESCSCWNARCGAEAVRIFIGEETGLARWKGFAGRRALCRGRTHARRAGVIGPTRMAYDR